MAQIWTPQPNNSTLNVYHLEQGTDSTTTQLRRVSFAWMANCDFNYLGNPALTSAASIESGKSPHFMADT